MPRIIHDRGVLRELVHEGIGPDFIADFDVDGIVTEIDARPDLRYGVTTDEDLFGGINEEPPGLITDDAWTELLQRHDTAE